MKLQGYLYRILLSPFLFMVYLISGIINAFVSWYLFVKIGGEFYVYKDKKEKESIGDIFNLLQQQYKLEK